MFALVLVQSKLSKSDTGFVCLRVGYQGLSGPIRLTHWSKVDLQIFKNQLRFSVKTGSKKGNIFVS